VLNNQNPEIDIQIHGGFAAFGIFVLAYCGLLRFLSLDRLDRFSCASFVSRSSFETVSTIRSGLLGRSPGVSPGTSGAG
jgi:hypothetical protein